MAEVLPNTLGAIESLSQSVQECLATFAPKLEGSSDSPNQYIAKTQFLCARLHWWAVSSGILAFETSSASVIADYRVETHQQEIWNSLRMISVSARDLPGNLEQVSAQIHGLESILPPNTSLNGTVFFNKALATCPPQLMRLGGLTDVDTFTALFAQLKATSLTHISKIPVRRSLSDSPEIIRRDEKDSPWAKYSENSVFLHEKDVHELSDHINLSRCLAKMISQLEILDQIKDLRTLPCLGFICKAPSWGRFFKYTVVYSTRKYATSLRDMLHPKNSDRFRSTLGMRLEIAKSLSRSILYLHTAECLHRGVSSSNVIFCSDIDFSDPHVRFELPYLAGFDYPCVTTAEEANVRSHFYMEERHIYRHPNCWHDPSTHSSSHLGDTGRYSKNQDIYGLGVILVELGILKPALQMWDRFSKKKGRGQNFQEYLIAKIIPEVRSKMGDAYADAALYCLQSQVPSGESNSIGVAAFYENVVTRLEECTRVIMAMLYLLLNFLLIKEAGVSSTPSLPIQDSIQQTVKRSNGEGLN